MHPISRYKKKCEDRESEGSLERVFEEIDLDEMHCGCSLLLRWTAAVRTFNACACCGFLLLFM